QTVFKQRIEVACQGCPVGCEQLREASHGNWPFGEDETQKRELRDFQTSRRQMTAVDLRHAPRRPAQAKARALGGREPQRLSGHRAILVSPLVTANKERVDARK